MKKIIFAIIFSIVCASGYAGEDGGLAGAAYIRANLSALNTGVGIASTSFTQALDQNLIGELATYSGNKTISGTLTQVGTATFQQRIRASAGTDALPSIANASDPDTGIGWSNPNELTISAGGNAIIRIDTTQLFSLYPIYSWSQGFKAPPGYGQPWYRFAGDSDGLGRNAQYQPNMWANNTEIQRWATDSTTIMATATFQQRAYFPAGSTTKPGISFSGDDDTGWHLWGANTIFEYVGATLVRNIQATSMTFYTPITVTGDISAGGVGGLRIKYANAATNTPTLAYNDDATSGFGRGADKKPNAIADSTEIQRWATDSTQIFKPVIVASTTSPTSGSMITPEGGTAILLLASGVASLNRGDVVELDEIVDNRCVLVTINDDQPIGTVYGGIDGSTSCNVGSYAWIVTNGIGYVKLDSSGATTPGGILYIDGEAGVAKWAASVPVATNHNREIGHNLASGSASAVVKAVLHFN